MLTEHLETSETRLVNRQVDGWQSFRGLSKGVEDLKPDDNLMEKTRPAQLSSIAA